MTDEQELVYAIVLFLIACPIAGFLFHIGWKVLDLIWR